MPTIYGGGRSLRKKVVEDAATHKAAAVEARRPCYPSDVPEIPELEAIKGYFTEHVAGKSIASAEARIPFVATTLSANVEGTVAD